MKKPLMVILIVVVLAIGGGFAYLLTSGDKSADSPRATSMTEVTTETAPPVSDASRPGAYVEYQPSLINSTPGTKVLFFHAPWCPQCRQLESEIKAGTLPENTTIFKVDYDSNQALRQKYGVTLQTTFVAVDSQGNLIDKYTAYDDPTLEAIKQNIL
jgi:thiol-disulfide isomerase/thioredoxin